MEEVFMTKLLLSIAAGALLGFLYGKFIGCRSGTCPLTSNPYTAMIYGAVLGGLFGKA